MKLLILAGGSGTRLWPLSRVSTPKQVQPFFDKRTLLQHTWGRLRGGFSAGDILVSTTAANVGEVRRQLPRLRAGNIIVEPVGRNTAAAIGLAARVIANRFPNEVVATVNSDHYVGQPGRFVALLKRAGRAVRRFPASVVLIGITPTYPETGYGYIKIGRKLGAGMCSVARFTEKPALARARTFLRTGRYLWNSGIFVFYPQELLRHYRQLQPAFYRQLAALPLRTVRSGAVTTGRSAWLRLPARSIDYAVVEHLKQLMVVQGTFAWADIGHWRTIYDILQRSGAGTVRGLHVGLDSQRNLIYGEPQKLIATVGVHDVVIIDTPGALLVCPRERAQDVRRLVVRLRRLGLTRHL